jgi:hypothetical protein
MIELRVDLDTATREELVTEVIRLKAVVDRWSSAWQQIVKANADVWVDQVIELKSRVEMLEKLL